MWKVSEQLQIHHCHHLVTRIGVLLSLDTELLLPHDRGADDELGEAGDVGAARATRIEGEGARRPTGKKLGSGDVGAPSLNWWP